MRFSLFKTAKDKRIYLDYSAATPIDSRVSEAMHLAEQNLWANSSSLHQEGEVAKKALDEARIKVARILHCKRGEVYFTSGGTEAINIAIDGVIMNAKRYVANPHIIVSSIEHPAVIEKVKSLVNWGVEVSFVAPDEEGLINPESIERELRKETALVIVMHTQNEIGTLQPVQKISRLIRGRAVFMIDASQGALYEDVSIERLGADILILDGIKIYGPRGVGVLVIKEKVEVVPSIFGGGQERGLRPGTENVVGAVGLAKALEIAVEKRESEKVRLTNLRDYCITRIEKEIPCSSLNGSPTERIANNVNFCFQGIDSEFVVIKLDTMGFAVSSASACKAIALENSSYVIEALGKKECAGSSLRFTFGRETTKSDIDKLIDALKKVLTPPASQSLGSLP